MIVIAPKRYEKVVAEDGSATLRFITFLESLVPTEADSVMADFTTSSSITLICNNPLPITIFLNASPANGETVIIKRRNAVVTVDGNGQTFDGLATTDLLNPFDRTTLVFTDAGGEWSIL